MALDTFCDKCGYDVGMGSHWHCAACGKVSSMMGHSYRRTDGSWGMSCTDRENGTYEPRKLYGRAQPASE